MNGREQVSGESLQRPVGELVAEEYARAAVLARHGVDFCCGGRRTLAQACASAGVSPDDVLRDLEKLERTDVSSNGPEMESWPLGRIARHIEDVHHAYVRETLPVLRRWSAKIARVHGKAHPELREVEGAVNELSVEMERHMDDEEVRLFPLLSSIEGPGDGVARDGAAGECAAGERAAGGETAGFSPISEDVLRELEDDHDQAGELMRRIRGLTHGYTPPAGACSTYAATFALLHEFEGDLHRHVHLENNVLFPRARSFSG